MPEIDRGTEGEVPSISGLHLTGRQQARPAMELRVGNRYRLGRKIGSGSFGDIYLGKS